MQKAKAKIAILGAGLSGLVVAQTLKKHAAVTVFEKSRGPGGRMSTRQQDDIFFDHGAQYFTARGRRFKKFLAPFLQSGVVKAWNAKVTTLELGLKEYNRIWFEPHYVGAPHMNSLCIALSAELDVRYQTRVAPLRGDSPPWQLKSSDDDYLGAYDWVLSTAPAQQTIELFPGIVFNETSLSAVKMLACHTLMLQLDKEPNIGWDAAVVKNSIIEWIALNSRKPKRCMDQPNVIVHSANQWAEDTRTMPLDEVKSRLTDELFQLTPVNPSDVLQNTVHRWRYAAVNRPLGEDYLLSKAHQLAACGDWCLEGRVEGAYLSGQRLAHELVSLI